MHSSIAGGRFHSLRVVELVRGMQPINGETYHLHPRVASCFLEKFPENSTGKKSMPLRAKKIVQDLFRICSGFF